MAVRVYVDGAVMVVVIDRPEVRNALDPGALTELCAAWRELDANPALRVGLVTGAGDQAFCAGADLRSTVPALADDEDLDLLERALLVREAPGKPLVAAVNGYCLGGGLILLAGTDIRMASTSATFGTRAAEMGLYPIGAIPALLGELPYAVAADLLLSGDYFAADVAHRVGLVSRLVEPAALMDTALALAHRLSTFDERSISAMKRMLLAARSAPSSNAELDRTLAGEILLAKSRPYGDTPRSPLDS